MPGPTEKTVSIERLREVLNYDADNGVLTWRKISPFGPSRVGGPAGSLSSQGYIQLRVDGVHMLANRAAWALYYGEWPKGQIKYLDGNKTNNRISNLKILEKVGKARSALTIDRLKSLLEYDPATGDFAWRVNTARCPKGHKAGTIQKIGYVYIAVDNVLHLGHRLAYFYMTGKWPENHIDHINGDRSDNRWINLRPATAAQNTWNSTPRSGNTSGYKGVSFSKSKNKWTARIGQNYMTHILGYYDTKEEAAAAYAEKAKALHGEFAKSTPLKGGKEVK